MRLEKNGTLAMTTAKNKIFIGLWHKNYYLVCIFRLVVRLPSSPIRWKTVVSASIIILKI